MLSREKIEAYRRMKPEERWREVEDLMTLAWEGLLQLSPSERRRRLDLIREEKDKSDVLWRECLGRVR